MIHSTAGPHQLAIARIWVFGLWIVVVLQSRPHLYEGLPSELVAPSGAMRLVPVEWLVTTPGAPQAIALVALFGCLLCVAGVRPFTPLALTTVAALTVHDGLMKSIGSYSNHGQFALLVGALVVASFPAADAYSVAALVRRNRALTAQSRRELYTVPMTSMAVLMAVAYAMIGTRRLVEGGLGIFADDSMLLWSVQTTLAPNHYDWDFGLLLLDHPSLRPIVAVGFLVTTIAEIASPLALTSARFRAAWLAIIVPFHVATLVMMHIFFWENVLLLVLLFTPVAYVVPRWIDRFAAHRSGHGSRRRAPETAA